jgi:hypothetical protein
MSNLRESFETYVKRVKELAEHVRGNEQATRQSLIDPFFTMLGYDLTDPRECVPEYKADFGKDRSPGSTSSLRTTSRRIRTIVRSAPSRPRQGGHRRCPRRPGG